MTPTATARRSAAVLVTALLLGLLVACGGDDSSSSSKSTPSPTFDAAAAEAQIKSNWESFFDAKQPVAARVALLEEAASLQKALQQQAKNPQAKGTSAKVTKVAVDASHAMATVTYNIYIKGTKVINGGTGQAVYINGKWYVSKATFCGLARLATSNVPGCA